MSIDRIGALRDIPQQSYQGPRSRHPVDSPSHKCEQSRINKREQRKPGQDSNIEDCKYGEQGGNASNKNGGPGSLMRDRKSTRLNSSHGYISYAVFCLKKKNITRMLEIQT